MSNESIFSFLENEFENIYNQCIELESNIKNREYSSAMTTSRKVGEFTAKEICMRSKKKSVRKLVNDNQDERISGLKRNKIINNDYYKIYDAIRLNGNRSVHRENQNFTFLDAEAMHEYCFKITVHLYKLYGENRSNIPKKYVFDLKTESINIDTVPREDIGQMVKESVNTYLNGSFESFADLNDSQRKAVTYEGDKHLIIRSGPGAGKTRVLIERVAYLINEKDVDPESILVITFTRKAADELKHRLSQRFKHNGLHIVNQMHISTIHSFCNSLLSDFGCSGLEILADDHDEMKNIFIRKHREELGFTGKAYISNSQLQGVINSFDEYSTFEVDTPSLVKYIEENFPINPSYEAFIEECMLKSEHFNFPYEDVKENEVYKESWTNAKYLAVAKAYPKYIELLEQENMADYNYLQKKALNFLKNRDDYTLRFKNIFVDEFQDTDPVQMQIFTILMENCKRFTVVGDEDQSIYSFRGSNSQIFEDFKNNENTEVISLTTNYRSRENINNFNREFINSSIGNIIRPADLEKNTEANNQKDSTVFFIENETKNQQAVNIAETIKYLKEEGYINNYSDVGVLMRTVRSHSNGLIELLDELDKRDIEYNIQNNADFIECEEVKFALFMLWLVYDNFNPNILTDWEKEWLNLRYFKQANNILKLSDETIDILCEMEDDYQDDVIDAENEIYHEIYGKRSRTTSFKGVFNRKEEVLDKIFLRVKKPVISELNKEELIEKGIKNEKDLEFFTKLHTLKNEMKNPENEELTLLNIYYHLLNLNSYLDNLFEREDEEEAENKLLNLALLSNSIHNYEALIGNNLNGLFWFLNNNVKNLSTSDAQAKQDTNPKDKVQIMTIHKSKGLEFPVIILTSLEELRFPRKYTPNENKPKHINKIETFPTPTDFLQFKNPDNEQTHIAEENRVLYVAMTRAEDILFLSSIPHTSRKKKEKDIKTPKIITEMQNLENTNTNLKIRQYTYQDKHKLYPTDAKEKPELPEVIDLSYTSYCEYDKCPYSYKLGYYYNFNISSNEYTKKGLVAHNILNQLYNHGFYKNPENITKEDIEKIAQDTIEMNKGIINETEAKEVTENIKKYWEKHGKNFKVYASEYPFSIKKENYELTGRVDLITEDEEGNLQIIDYKTTSFRNNLHDEQYKQQLYIYYMALENNPDFQNKNINKLGIYAIEDSDLKTYEINPRKIKRLEKNLTDAAQDIIDKKFDKDPSPLPYELNDQDRCEICEYSKILCKGREK